MDFSVRKPSAAALLKAGLPRDNRVPVAVATAGQAAASNDKPQGVKKPELLIKPATKYKRNKGASNDTSRLRDEYRSGQNLKQVPQSKKH